MGERAQITALAVANLAAVLAAAALIAGLVWLLVATIRHHLRAAAQRRAFHATARDAAGTSDSNELRHIDLSSVDLDAELLQLIEGGDSK